MAAKKAATRSRTSSKKGKSSLKWWYILPVLAIVVLAGYLIIRYSEAGTAYKRVGNGLSGGVKTVDKQGNYGKAREIGNNPVSAKWSPSERGTSTRFCAQVYGSGTNGGNGGVTLTLYNENGTQLTQETHFFKGVKTYCTNSLGNVEKLKLAGRDAVLKVSEAGGYVSVIKMYATQ